jgi:hypothetical protein
MKVESQFLFHFSIKYKIPKFGHLATCNGQLGWVKARATENKNGYHKIHFSKLQNFNCSSFQFMCVNDGMGLISTMVLGIKKKM